MTSKHSQQNPENSMYSQLGFHAKICPSQGNNEVSMNAQDQDSSMKALDYLGKFDLDSPYLKTLEIYSLTKRGRLSKKSSFKLPKQGTMLNGQLFRQKIWEPVILESECGLLRTPTTMDSKEESMKHATKMLQGKTHRSSGQPIQQTLSDQVIMDLLIKNPELMKIYQDHQMEERPHLPTQEEFVDYIWEQTTIKELAAKTSIKKTTIEHWFRRDKAGFSYPTVENWKEIKPHLKTIKFDMEMTTIESKEWTTKDQMLPTPRANPAMSQNLNLPSIKNHKNPNLETVIANLPTPDLLPTPTAMDHLPQRGYESMKKQAEVHRKGRTKLANLREAVNPEAVELFNKLQKHQTLPTPSAMEHKATAKKWNHQSGKMLSSIARRGELSPQTGKDMFLNPAFVEEMMGYPIGWLV